MIFTEISNEELEKFQQNNNERYFFPQSAEYSSLSAGPLADCPKKWTGFWPGPTAKRPNQS